MEMASSGSLVIIGIATIFFILQGAGVFDISMNPYVPWIALIILRHPLQKDFFKPLLQAATIGMFVDLFSDLPLGVYPISYALGAALLFRFRNRFLYDRPFHFMIFAMLTSLLTSILQLLLLFLFDRMVPLSGQWTFFNVLVSGLVDGIFALIWFSGSLYLLVKMRRNWVLFWQKMRRFPT